MRKKLISLLLIVSMLLSVGAPMSVYAAEPAVDVVVGNIQNGTVDVDVVISGNPEVAGMVVRLYFDSYKLTPISMDKGTILGDSLSNMEQSGVDESSLRYVSLQFAEAENMTMNGTLFTVTFDVEDVNLEDSSLYVTVNSAANQNLQDVAFDVVSYFTLGDVNEDGVININDALAIMQNIVGVTEFVDMQSKAANVDISNENININDALKVMQYIVGIIGEF